MDSKYFFNSLTLAKHVAPYVDTKYEVGTLL